MGIEGTIVSADNYLMKEMRPTTILQIAIDGPVAAGKGTIAGKLARTLDIFFVNTGGMYRALAYAGIQEKTDFSSDTEIIALLNRHTISAQRIKNDCIILLDGKDVTSDIDNRVVADTTPSVSKIREVRAKLVAEQQRISNAQSVIMEGHGDIGNTVLPNAQLKIYLDADIEERVQRRFKQILENGKEATIEEVRRELIERDQRDAAREVDPLRILPDAWVLNTTGLSEDAVITMILERLHEKGLIKEIETI